MSFFNKVENKTKDITLAKPSDVYIKLLKSISGSDLKRELKFDIFYRKFVFRGIKDGVGTSIICANTALALAQLNLSVLVIDTSIVSPSQDELLKTIKKIDKDWFDLPFTTESVLRQSKYNNNISVLAFRNREILDMLGRNDNEYIVNMALDKFEKTFDIILVDCCAEPTAINATILQRAHRVFQVWNDNPIALSNLDSSITNNTLLSCPLDKTRNIIINKVAKEVQGVNAIDALISEYHVHKLATIPFSEEIYHAVALGIPLWNYESKHQDIQKFTESIIRIVFNILNIKTQDDIDNSIKVKTQGNVETTETTSEEFVEMEE